jgi:hypothetical protein
MLAGTTGVRLSLGFKLSVIASHFCSLDATGEAAASKGAPAAQAAACTN